MSVGGVLAVVVVLSSTNRLKVALLVVIVKGLGVCFVAGGVLAST